MKKELKLQDLPGIGPTSIEKLEKGGILDVMAFASRTPSQISDATGVSQSVARKAIHFVKDELELGLTTLTKYKEKSEKPYFISTGSIELDNLMGGGVRSGSITEVHAEGGVSKSMLALTLAVNTVIGGDKVIFLDTESAFRGERIKSILDAKRLEFDKAWEEGVEDKIPVKDIYKSFEDFLDKKFKVKTLDEKTVFDNIIFSSVDNSDFQMLLMDDVEKMCSEDKKIKLMIIDSITEHFRSEFLGRCALNERQLKINKHMADIKRLTKRHNLAVYLTNQVMSDPGQMFGDPIKPVLGNIFAHKCLDKETILLTKNGFKTIEEVNIGDYVWGKDKFVKILDKSPKRNRKCKKIRSNNFIIASNEHIFPILYNKYDGLVDFKVSSIKKGDCMISPEMVKIKTKVFKNPIKPFRLAKFKEKTAKLIIKQMKGYSKDNEVEDFVGITKRQFRRVLNEYYPTKLEVIENLIDYYLGRLNMNTNDYELVNTEKYRNISMPSSFDKDVMRLYGAWVCDGSKTHTNEFTISKEQKSYLEELQKIVKKLFGISGRIVKVNNKNCYRLIVCSKEIHDLMRIINFDDIMFMEDEIVLEFLASLIDGDGCFTKHGMTYSEKNKNMMTKLQMLLYRFGIKSNISKTNLGIYILYINIYNRGLIEKRLLNKEKIKLDKNKIWDIKKQIIRHSIKSMEDVGIKETYDITVEGHYFMANGIITHNCDTRLYLKRGRNNTRVAKLVKSRYLEDGESAFQVGQIGIMDI